MATLLLTTVTAAQGASWYTVAAASLLGSYLDRTYLFPEPDIEAPKVGDLRAQAGSEGMSLNFALGPQCRVPGKIVDIAGPSSVIGGTLRRNLVIDVCQGEVEEDEFVDQIFANGKKVYDVTPDIDIVSDQIAVSLISLGNDGYGNGNATIEITCKDIEKSLLVLKAGYVVGISGFALPGYNKPDWKLVSTTTVIGQESWTRARLWNTGPEAGYWGPDFGGLPGVAGEAEGATVTVHQDLPQVTAGSFAGINQHRGTADQMPDAAGNQIYTDGSNPARRGRAWIYLSLFNVTASGGIVPNIEIVFRQKASMTIAEAITALVKRAGLDLAYLDVSQVTGNIRGLVADEPIDSRVLLQILMQVYGVRYREVDGKMVFYMASDPDVVDVEAADLAAYADGDEKPPRLIEFVDPPSRELPSRVEVEFSNADNGLQQGNARDTLHALQGGTKKVLRIRTPLTLTEAEAKAFARRQMMDRHATRVSRSTILPPQYLHITEGDLWRTTVDGKALTSVANSVEYGANRLVRITGSQMQPQVAGIDAADIASEGQTGSDGGLGTPLSLDLVIVDSAPLTDSDATRSGIYFACPDYALPQDFIGGQIYRQLPGASGFDPAQDVPGLATHGIVYAVGDHAWDGADPAYWDRRSELIVHTSGTFQLTSSTEDAVVGGANRAFYGSELIAWVDAEDLGDGRFKLTNLLRGLRGTEWAIPPDGTTFRNFVPVEGLTFHELPQSSLDQFMSMKAVGVHWDEADVPPINLIPHLRTRIPFQVYGIRGSRDTSDNLTVTWERQTRAIHPIFSSSPAPLMEDEEAYEIDVLIGGEPSPGSPFSAGVGKSWTYDASEQASDGITPGDPVEFVIYQMGSLGRGHGRTQTL